MPNIEFVCPNCSTENNIAVMGETKNRRTFSLARRGPFYLDSGEQEPKGLITDIISQSVVTDLDLLALSVVGQA